ncbi:MAG: Stk1 family PASTA domain-containing Ser/Thr kinase [Actinomycetaceae bacterium]|nr:Stk1 family PASTA domain-containing Ser/Thr kinase [Actinomycetaceae bacterium]
MRRICTVGLFSNWRQQAQQGNQPDASTPDAPAQPLPEQAPVGTDSNVKTAPTEEPQVIADPLVGMRIDDRYRIVSLLARGGMATVYTGYDTRLERPVAVKVMHPHLAQSEDFVQRFRREARSAARIIHPSVVSVFDQGVVGGSGYLVMELVSGVSLRDKLNAEGSFEVAYALEVTEAILRALVAAHRNGVIHRDIKPENVLVPDEGPVKVVDFGLARAASDVSAASTGSVLGTVAYLPPELVSEDNPDGRCDLYALGIMLFEMITGHTPFEDRSAIQIAWAHVNEDVPPPSRLERWLPPEVDDFVCTLAARQRDDRPADAQTALDDLIKLRAQLPDEVLHRRAEVELPNPNEALTAPVRTHGQTVALPLGGDSAVPVKAKTAKPRKRRRAPLIVTTVIMLLAVSSVAFGWWWTQYGPGAYITVPVLTGKTEAEATETLQALDLKVGLNQDFSDDIGEGLVIRTDPDGGGKIHKSGTVTLVLSKGVKMVEVPNLVASTKEDALAKLQEVDLSAGTVSEEYSETMGKGQVVSQSLEPGSSQVHGSAVDLVISKGREPLKVPELVGKDISDAQKLLADTGLGVSVVEEFSDDVGKGVVISQKPAAEETLYRNDPVELVVSKGPETVTVPDVVRMSEADAIATLEAAGLNVKVTRIYVVFGNVAMTVPEAGEVVRVGSTVEIRLV